MPKLVDHEQRKAEIAAALWDLISIRGLEAVSLREAAAAAGVSMGRVQHYFKSKDEMLSYALELSNKRAQARIQARLVAMTGDPAPQVILRECLVEILGLDAAGRLNILVNLAYFIREVRAHDRGVSQAVSQDDPVLQDLVSGLIQAAQAAGDCAPDLDITQEATILLSLSLSLGIDVALRQRQPAEAVATLDYYLSRIFPASKLK